MRIFWDSRSVWLGRPFVRDDDVDRHLQARAPKDGIRGWWKRVVGSKTMEIRPPYPPEHLMNLRFDRAGSVTVIIFATAFVYAGFALWLAVDPDALLRAFGMDDPTHAMRTEIRAFYGGIELGIAAVMILLWKQRQLIAALWIGGLPIAGSACGRLIGMGIDGFSATHLIFAAFETVGLVMCLLGISLVGRDAKTKS